MLNLKTAESQATNANQTIEGDRRLGQRVERLATILVSNERCDLVPTELVECTTRGARVVLHPHAAPGQRVDFELTLSACRLSGFARVAWTRALPDGGKLAGLEFVDFSMSSLGK